MNEKTAARITEKITAMNPKLSPYFLKKIFILL